ncbi:MAG: MFS transporter, partial [Clostridiales bacterium]|nr:MFS transporter [Clostridiales bacterium]
MTNITEKLWTKNFIILSLLNFLLTLIFFMLNTTIVLYAVETFKASPSIGGLVSGAFIIGTLVSRLFIGNLINAKNSKKILLIGLILFTLGTSLYFIKRGITFLILTRFLHGITSGISSTVIGAIIAIIIPKSRKGEGVSYFSLSTALATALGPFIGLSLSQNAGFKTIFVFCLIVSIVTCVISLFFNNSKLIISESKNSKKEFRISNFIEIKALPISLIMFISSLCFSSVLSYINLFAIDNHLESTANLFFIVYAIAVLFTRPLTGKILDKKGANYIIYPALILFSLSLILLS